MEKAFIGNIRTHRLHIKKYAAGGCQLARMRKGNRVEFDSFNKAMQYEDEDGKSFVKCGICFPKAEKDGWKDEK